MWSSQIAHRAIHKSLPKTRLGLPLSSILWKILPWNVVSHAELYYKLEVLRGYVFYNLSLFRGVFQTVSNGRSCVTAAPILVAGGRELRDHFTRLMRVAADVITQFPLLRHKGYLGSLSTQIYTYACNRGCDSMLEAGNHRFCNLQLTNKAYVHITLSFPAEFSFTNYQASDSVAFGHL